MSMRSCAIAVAASMLVSTGCWEQLDGGKWFPQMKRQLAVQAFEENAIYHTEYGGQLQGFSPPEGTVPVSYAGVPDLGALDMVAQDAIANPVPSTLASLQRGQELYTRYCETCHGRGGGGDGPVAGPPFGTGPFGLVLPIGGPTSMARMLTDGHIYATISLGRGRMPNYARISPEDRWNVVNYVRELNGGGQ